jgi:radical SAM superfamily enzyme YgiQ (UPF0313 family)
LCVFVRVPSWLGNPSRHPENCEAPLDLGYGAALAEAAGFRWAIVDFETGRMGLEETVAALGREQPAFLFLSGITPAVPRMLALAASVREVCPDTCIVAFGQHAHALPETFLFPESPVDLCIRGELEATLPAVLAAGAGRARRAALSGTVTFDDGAVSDHGTREPVADLDVLPRPRHEAFLNPHYRYLHPMRLTARHRWGFLQGGRGCPHPCIYCSKALRTSYGPRMRYRSAASIVEEMRFLERHGVNVMVFTDDAFTQDRERVMVLCDAIRTAGLRIRWTTEGRVRPADLEMYRAMRAANCTTFSMGVESGSPRILETLDKRATVEEAERAFALAREAGLLRVGFFMVGCPGETEADFEDTRNLMLRLDPDMIQVAFFTGYPGSRAYERYGYAGLPWEDFQHYERLRNVSAVPDDVVRGWQRRLYREFALRPRFLARYLWQKNLNLLLNPRTEGFLVIQGLRQLLWK